jgi:hypothetical protein
MGCSAPQLPQGLPPPEYEPAVLPSDAVTAAGASGQGVEATPAPEPAGGSGGAPLLPPPGGTNGSGGAGTGP